MDIEMLHRQQHTCMLSCFRIYWSLFTWIGSTGASWVGGSTGFAGCLGKGGSLETAALEGSAGVSLVVAHAVSCGSRFICTLDEAWSLHRDIGLICGTKVSASLWGPASEGCCCARSIKYRSWTSVLGWSFSRWSCPLKRSGSLFSQFQEVS